MQGGARSARALGGRRGWVGVVLLLGLTLPGAVQAAGESKLTETDGSPLGSPYAGWVKRAHAPLPTGRIRIGFEGCPRHPELYGCVRTDRPRTIHLSPDVRSRRAVFFHELGHVFDLTTLRPRDRAGFKRLHGRANRSWWSGENPTAEWFAEAYSLCARYGTRWPRSVLTTYRYRPSPRRARSSCELIRASVDRPSAKPPTPPPAPPIVTEPPPQAPPAETPPEDPRCWLLIFCA